MARRDINFESKLTVVETLKIMDTTLAELNNKAKDELEKLNNLKKLGFKKGQKEKIENSIATVNNEFQLMELKYKSFKERLKGSNSLGKGK